MHLSSIVIPVRKGYPNCDRWLCNADIKRRTIEADPQRKAFW